MPFLTYQCKGNATTNNGPHKTVVFVPASAMGSNSPNASGGNIGAVGAASSQGGGAVQAIITCPRCSFTAQPGDGNMSSIGNGLDSVFQERSLINSAQAPQASPANSPAALAIPGADSAIRIPIGSPGNASGLNSQALGVTVPTLLGAGFRQLL
jgi:hypothetical protein